MCGYTIILLLEKIIFDVHAHDDNGNQENKEISLGDFEIKNLTPINNVENQKKKHSFALSEFTLGHHNSKSQTIKICSDNTFLMDRDTEANRNVSKEKAGPNGGELTLKEPLILNKHMMLSTEFNKSFLDNVGNNNLRNSCLPQLTKSIN